MTTRCAAAQLRPDHHSSEPREMRRAPRPPPNNNQNIRVRTRKLQRQERHGETPDTRCPRIERGRFMRRRVASFVATALLLGLLLHRLLTQDLTRRHEAIRAGQKMGSRRDNKSGGSVTVHRASYQVHACIPPGHWSSGGGSRCRRGCWKAERAASAAGSVPWMSASLACM